MKKITVNQYDGSSLVKQLAAPWRLLLGLVASALLAYYVPMIAVALTGRWVNNLTMWIEVALFVGALSVVNIIGNKLKRNWLIAIIVAVFWTFYECTLVARGSALEDWNRWWVLLALPLPMCLINAGVFERYKKWAALASS